MVGHSFKPLATGLTKICDVSSVRSIPPGEGVPARCGYTSLSPPKARVPTLEVYRMSLFSSRSRRRCCAGLSSMEAENAPHVSFETPRPGKLVAIRIGRRTIFATTGHRAVIARFWMFLRPGPSCALMCLARQCTGIFPSALQFWDTGIPALQAAPGGRRQA
jgi:hypothetical protein